MYATGMSFGLGEEVDALRETVRRFAQERIAPLAADIDRTNAFPMDLWTEMGELGLLGMTADPEFGGTGMGYLAHAVAMEEISRASAVRRPFLRRAFQSLRQPDQPLGLGRAEEEIPAEALLGRGRGGARRCPSRAPAPTWYR